MAAVGGLPSAVFRPFLRRSSVARRRSAV